MRTRKLQTGWVEGWDVVGSSGDMYRVSRKADGTFGCSCPGWKFKKAPKPDCKHITAILRGVGQPISKAVPTYSCLECGRVFRSNGELTLHLMSCLSDRFPLTKPEPPQDVQVNGDRFTITRKFKLDMGD